MLWLLVVHIRFKRLFSRVGKAAVSTSKAEAGLGVEKEEPSITVTSTTSESNFMGEEAAVSEYILRCISYASPVEMAYKRMNPCPQI